MLIPSITESKQIILDNALSHAKKILEDRFLLFQITEDMEKADEVIATHVDAFIEKEDIEGIAASLLQNYKFFEQGTLSAKLASKIEKLLLEKADHYYFDEGLYKRALVYYQLAAGLNSESVDALCGVQAACIHSEPSKEETALPYAVVTLHLDPEKNSVGYIIKKMNVSETYNMIHAVEGYNYERQQSDSAWYLAGRNKLRTGSALQEITLPLTLCWTFKKCSWIQGGIVSSRTIAVFGDRNGELYGIRLQDGKKLWKHDMGGFLSGTPVINGEFVFTGTSYGARCIHLTSGKKIWKTKGNGGKSYSIAGSGCVFYKNGYVFFCDDKLTICNAKNGKIEGQFDTNFEPHIHTGACSSGEYVFIPAYHHIMVLSLYSGAIIEQFHIDGTITAGPVIADNLIIVGTDHSTIEAFSLENRSRRWCYQIEKNSYPVESRPVYADGKIFFGGPDGIVYALDAKNGKELWRYTTGSRIESSPAGCKGVIIILSSSGILSLLSSENGNPLWQYKNPEGPISPATCSPVIAGGYLLTGWNGLHAFCSK
jgi:outer membrane protein assembly factor BamB